MQREKESPVALAGAHRAYSDLAINSPDHSDVRALAQRCLARKVAAGAGLSDAVAAVMVVIACGDGGRP